MAKKTSKASEKQSSAPQMEIVLSPLFELKDPKYKVRYAEMTEEEMKESARQYAKLVLDAVEREMGGLPPPPSEEEFHRLWNELVNKKMDIKKVEEDK